MKKIGIDLGSSSLGWVIIEDGKIEKKGVVRFNAGMMKGQTGGYVSPTKTRRDARSKRNLIRARKYRKWELLKILINGGYVPLTNFELENWNKYKKGCVRTFPENEIFLKWLACDFRYEEGINFKNPYELRVKATTTKLSKHEFGRVLYHLVQRRGYKDIGENNSETENQKDRRGGENGFQNALDKNDKLISKALLNEFLNKNKRARNQYPYRDEYNYELDIICKAQGIDVSKYENKDGCYNDEFIKKLWKAIIWQRDLKSQKGNIGKCTLEPKKLRCPISHPIFEIFRTWEFINTIKYFDDNGEKQVIPQDIKIKLFEFFLKKDKNFKFEELRIFIDKQLQSKKRYNFPINKNKKNLNNKYEDGIYDTSVAGMPVCKGLIDIFGEVVHHSLYTIESQNTSRKEKCGGFGNATKIISNYSIFDLWHILFTFDRKAAKEKNFLSEFAKKKLNFTDEKQITKFERLKDNFIQGYANLSINAMCKILPFLKEGYLYNEAVILAKIPELLNENWQINKDKILTAIRQANISYEWDKMITSITNNLIDKYKGLKDNEIYEYRDFEYNLSKSDFIDVESASQGYFGSKTWEKRSDKNIIIEAVNLKYQEFFHDETRAYKKSQNLDYFLNNNLKNLNINIETKQLYHHSNTENIYLKNCQTDILQEKPILPQSKNKLGYYVDVLPSAQIDSIKNPMFNKAMSILRRLMNEFIKEGIIDNETEVVIEIARELNDNNRRIAIERYQNERRVNREKYREFLTEFKKKENLGINIEGCISKFELWTEQIFEEILDEKNNKIKNKNRIEILKEKDALKRYELWNEQKGQCMYTGKMISLSKLFSNEIDIEHTIPRSILPDDTMANQTVCFAWYNRNKKKNQMPIQCNNFSKDEEGWGTKIEQRLDSWIKLRDFYQNNYEKRQKPTGIEDEPQKNKRIQEKHYYKLHYDYWNEKIERFKAEEVKDSWAKRQLTDTQMISKYAREYLKTYFMKVAVQKGTVTAIFRKIFGFQEEDVIKSRNKHTHHAIDALVLTLIPTNSSYRERILKEYFNAIENNERDNIKTIQRSELPHNYNVQKFISEIENTTLIYNYEKDRILKQTKKVVRKRGKRQYLKDKNGKFILDKNGNTILLIAKGDTIRSELYAQTYLGKIRDVERDENGRPKKHGNDWRYKTGTDEFCYVKRENIEKVKTSDSLISSIVDPEIQKLILSNKNKPQIIDFQGNTIRHVRIRTKAGREVKIRRNYLSKHDYKNKFYAEAGLIPYAILLQKNDNGEVKRELIPVASYEISKIYKETGIFDYNIYIHKFHAQYKDWEKQILKVGQKVFVLNDDEEYEKRNNIDFQKNRLYVITQFSEGSIWLKHHLCALSKDEVKHSINIAKDELLKAYETKYNIPEIVEDLKIFDNKSRHEDYETRKFRFDTIEKSYRLTRIKETIGIEKTKLIKKELDKFKAIPSNIEVEGKTYLLKMSKDNWNFLIAKNDFEMKPDGTIIFKKSEIK